MSRFPQDSDFDEDLSELGEYEEQELDEEENMELCQDKTCNCGETDNPDCTYMQDWREAMSRRSYDGSDADDYYDLKGLRVERKKLKIELREEKDRAWKFEERKRQEVCAVYKIVQRAEKESQIAPMDSISGHTYQLFSPDHVDYFFHPPQGFRRGTISFDHLDERGEYIQVPDERFQTMWCELSLLEGLVTSYGPFNMPTYPGTHMLDLDPHLKIKFLGNGYLILHVSRDFISMNRFYKVPSDFPEMMTYYGILPEWKVGGTTTIYSAV